MLHPSCHDLLVAGARLINSDQPNLLGQRVTPTVAAINLLWQNALKASGGAAVTRP